MKKETIGWIDALRVLACFMVVLSHCCDPFVGAFDTDRTAFLTGEFIGSLVRPCVPLFAMMTGALLLPVRASLPDFYRKRLGRLAVPLVFWSLVLPVLFFLYVHYGPATQSPNIDPAQFVAGSQLVKMLTFVFNFNYDTTPLWYLYMLGGLYLMLPVVSAWLERAERREVKLYLKVWGLSLFLPYVQLFAPALGYAGNYGNMGLLGVCDWNAYGTFYYVSGFLGYMVLAHYLVKYPLQWSRGRLLGVSAVMFVSGYLITAFGFDAIQQRYPGDYAYLEILWLFTGVNVFLMTLPVFWLMQRWSGRAPGWVRMLAGLSFGIYLCHFVFVQAAYDLFDGVALPVGLRIPLMALVAFAASGVVVWVLQRIPGMRRTVM